MSCSSLDISPVLSRQGSFSPEEPNLTIWERVVLAVTTFFRSLYSCFFGEKEFAPSPAASTAPPSPRNFADFVEISVEFTLEQKLLRACEHGSIEEIQSLLKEGASLDTADRKGVTALMILCSRPFPPEGFLEAILKNCLKSTLTVRDHRGWTALNYAIANGRHRLFEPYLDRFDEEARESAVCAAMQYGCASYFLGLGWGKNSARVQFELSLAEPESPEQDSYSL